MITWREAEARIASGGTLTFRELEEVISKGGGRTADESERLFNACPEWVASNQAREAERKLLEEKFIEEEAFLRADLRKAGYRVKWVWDFVNSPDSYPEAVPILLDHLRRPYSDRTREGIARALTVKEARGVAGPVIIDVLRKSDGADPQFRWALANALTVVADRSVREEIKALAAIETTEIVRDRLRRAEKTAAKL